MTAYEMFFRISQYISIASLKIVSLKTKKNFNLELNVKTPDFFKSKKVKV